MRAHIIRLACSIRLYRELHLTQDEIRAVVQDIPDTVSCAKSAGRVLGKMYCSIFDMGKADNEKEVFERLLWRVIPLLYTTFDEAGRIHAGNEAALYLLEIRRYDAHNSLCRTTERSTPQRPAC